MRTAYACPPADASAVFSQAHALADDVERSLRSQHLLRSSHSEVEAFIEQQSRHWARLMLQAQFALRAELEQPVAVVGAEGVERSAVRPSQRHLETLVGTVAVPRLAYQEPDQQDLHPLDAVANLPHDHFSFGLRRLVATQSARASFEEVVELVRDRTGARVAKRQVEQLTVRAAADFEAFYAQRPALAEATDDLLVLSTDAKGVVMRHEDLREGTRRAALQKTNKLQTRLSPGEKADRKRMAQVCAVYSVAPFPRTPEDIVHGLHPQAPEVARPRPRHKRIWAGIEKSPRQVIRQAFEEALRRDPEQKRRWVVLVDGEPRQLRAVKAEAKRAKVKVTLLLDVVHVLEYLWKAGHALFGGTEQAEAWVGQRLRSLLAGRSGGEVAGTIRRWRAKREKVLDPAGRKALDKACGYLANRTRTRLMHYQEALRDGLPIGTGVIEGACRYLVKDRMDRTGACWSMKGAEAVLRLRALVTSGDFEAYWSFHLAREKERNHAARYANGELPDPLLMPQRHLRRIK